MAENSNKLSKFWQELKRRKVVRVSIIYATVAFILLQLIDILVDPLHLPEWVMTFFVVLLLVGFPIVVILAWIFDITPEGIEVTPPVEQKSESHAVPQSKRKVIILDVIIGVLLVVVLILAWPKLFKGGAELEKSIAILPVRNLGGDPTQEPMCAGLTSEIINQLAKIKSFDKIVPYQSVMSIETDMDAPEIAEKFGVNYLLETRYLKLGDKFRLNFSLIEPRDDKTIWQDEDERKYEEIISINTEIALGIANKLNAFISKEEKEQIEKGTTQNLEAYKLMQSVVYEFFTKVNFEYAYKDSLLKITELDPNWADPWATLATFSIFSSAEMPLPGFNGMDAIEYNQKAWELDPENLTVLLNQAIIEMWQNWNYIAAEDNFQKAFKIAPNTTHQYLIDAYIGFLFSMERYKEIPPLFSRLSERNDWEINVYEAMGQHEKVEAAIQEMIAEDRIWPVARYYIWKGEYEKAKALDDKYSLQNRITIPSILYAAELAILRYKTGDISGAQEIINWHKTLDYAILKYSLARYYSVIGDTESAFTYLNEAYEKKFFGMNMLKADPLLDNIREDDRFRELYAKVGLKDYDDYRARKKE